MLTALIILLLTSLTGFFLRQEKWIRILNLVGMVVSAFFTLWFTFAPGVSGLFVFGSLSSILAYLIVFVSLTAGIVSYRIIGHEYHEKILTLNDVRVYYGCFPLFVLSMLITIFSDNLGVLWIALEGTTLSTALLVALYKKDASIEAAWKYVLLCSIGISLGLLGVLMLVHAGMTAGLDSTQALSIRALIEHAPDLSTAIVKWAFVFLFVGIGTKVGFVPMHTWLPDAHGRTPSPISAMLSGLLLNVAFITLIRFKEIIDLVLQSTQWTQTFFLVFGALSVLIPAFILLQQRNYKRMLAYSSIEHMGLMALAIGFGPAGLVFAVMHMIGHTLIKSALFFTAGEILLKYKSAKIENVTDLMKQAPITGVLFTIGILLILALPPSALFVSELGLFSIGLQTHLFLSIFLIAGLSLIAIGMMKSLLAMLYGENDHATVVHTKERWNVTHSVVTAHFFLAIVLGFLFLSETGMTVITNIVSTSL